jgi:hypothetical protein
LLSVFVAHALPDIEFARELSAFLKIGCEVSIFGEDGLIGPGEDLLSVSETGLSADILLLVMTPASNPDKWVRERWEPLLIARAAELETHVAVVLLQECSFPALLRRGGRFFDATKDRLAALRKLKRWIWGRELGTEPAFTSSPDLERIYKEVADRVGVTTASAAEAKRFAREASREFETVLCLPAYRRSLAAIVCEAGVQLGIRLAGPAEEDCREVRALLSKRRCLLVLDAPTAFMEPPLPQGRTSVLTITDPAESIDEPASVGLARRLLAEGRVSHAFEVLTDLINREVEPEWCARELIWIYEQWDRMEDANRMRFLVTPSPGEQLGLLF